MNLKVLLLTSLFIFLITSCDDKNAEQLMEAAQKHIQNDAPDAAIISLKNAILKEPRNSEARLILGKLYLNKSYFVEAEKELRKASDLGVDNNTITPLLIKSLYYQNYLDEVVIVASNYQSTDKTSLSKVTLFGWIAQIKTGIANNSREIKLEKVNILGDDLKLADAYEFFLKGQTSNALNSLATLELNEEELEVLLMKAMIYAADEKFNESITYYAKAIELAPLFYIAHYQISEVLIKDKQLDKAEKYIDQLLTMNSQNAYANLLKAQVAFRRDEYETTFNSASIAVQNGMDTPFANLMAGISSYKLEKLESAYRHLNKVKDSLPANHYAIRVLAEIKLRLGETENIAELVNNFSGKPEEDASFMSTAAISMFRQGDIHHAIQFFEKSNAQTDNAVNLMREGLARLSVEDYTGISILEKAIETDNDMKYAWSLLAQAHLQNGDKEAAFSVAEKWQQRNKIEGDSLISYLHLQVGNNEQAREILEPIVASTPNHSGALRFLSMLNAQEKKFDQARPLAEQLVKLEHQKFQNYIDLLNIAISQEDEKSVESFILQMIDSAESNQKTIVMKTALSSLYNYQGKHEKTISLLTSIKSLSDETALSLLGEAYFYLKDYSAAFQVYNIWLGINPTSKNAWDKILTTFSYTRDYKLGLKAAKEAHNKFNDDIDIKGQLASFYIKNDDIDEAKKIIDDIAEIVPEAEILNLLNGELALHNGFQQQAINYLTKYYSQHPSLPTVQLLANALAENGHAIKGGQLIQDELDKSVVTSIDIHYIAEFYSKYGKLKEAAGYYELLLEKAPKEFITLNNYASTLVRLKQYQKAYETANNALKIIPDSPYAMDTAGWALLKLGKIKEALFYSSKAYEKLSNNSEVQLHLAEALIADNQTSKAKALLNKVKPSNTYEQSQLKLLNNLL